MDYLIQNAWAQGAGAAGEPGLASFLPLIILFVVFYLFLIRPQMKRQKEHTKMVEALAKGDEAVTNGGLLGRVTEVGDNFVKFEIAKGTEVKVQKHAIAQVMPKGTIKDS
ncbi:MAG: preprotein translocase subunit YajC [Gammaproteobacteria bacterium]